MSVSIRIHVVGIGLLGPGLDGWRASREILRGGQPWASGPMPTPSLAMLPPAERRRCPARVRIALGVACEAMQASGLAATDLASVFAASDDDGELSHAAFAALANDPPLASPTRFQNSVHNAAAGYWHIATGSRHASTSISAFDWTFAAALLEAATQLCVDPTPVLTVVCDMPLPPPLAGIRRVDAGLGVAMVLCAAAGADDVATLDLSIADRRSGETFMYAVPEPLRYTPSARALPLLAAIASASPTVIELDYLDDTVLRVSL